VVLFDLLIFPNLFTFKLLNSKFGLKGISVIESSLYKKKKSHFSYSAVRHSSRSCWLNSLNLEDLAVVPSIKRKQSTMKFPDSSWLHSKENAKKAVSGFRSFHFCYFSCIYGLVWFVSWIFFCFFFFFFALILENLFV